MQKTEIKSKKARTAIIIWFCALACLAWYLTESSHRDFKKDFDLFNASSLAGRVTYLYSSKNGERFNLDNSPQRYHIMTNDTWEGKELKNFTETAELGDSVYKAAFSGELILKKKATGHVYRFSIKNP